jgi:hypothetical protein
MHGKFKYGDKARPEKAVLELHAKVKKYDLSSILKDKSSDRKEEDRRGNRVRDRKEKLVERLQDDLLSRNMLILATIRRKARPA